MESGRVRSYPPEFDVLFHAAAHVLARHDHVVWCEQRPCACGITGLGIAPQNARPIVTEQPPGVTPLDAP